MHRTRGGRPRGGLGRREFFIVVRRARVVILRRIDEKYKLPAPAYDRAKVEKELRIERFLSPTK